MRKILLSIFALAVVLGLSGCATNLTSGSYEEGTVGQTQTVDYGVIVDAQEVKIQGTNTGVGGLAGAATGAVAGSYIGSGGRGSALGAIGGAVIGGIAGNMAEKGISGQTGVRYIVQLDHPKVVNENNVTSSNNNASLLNNGTTKTSVSKKQQTTQAISIVQGIDKKVGIIPVGTRVMILDGGTDRARVIAVHSK